MPVDFNIPMYDDGDVVSSADPEYGLESFALAATDPDTSAVAVAYHNNGFASIDLYCSQHKIVVAAFLDADQCDLIALALQQHARNIREKGGKNA